MKTNTYIVDLRGQNPCWNSSNAFSGSSDHKAVPYLLVWKAIEGEVVPQVEVTLSLDGGILSASIPDLLIPALLSLLGSDPKKRVVPELEGSTFESDGIRYQLRYIFDPEEHDYGWYIVAL